MLDDPEDWVPVADFAAANVEVFHPAIEVAKTADPTSLLGSGDVTYTYEVRNTGDVPFGGAERSVTTPVRRSPISVVTRTATACSTPPPASSRTPLTRPGSSPAKRSSTRTPPTS